MFKWQGRIDNEDGLEGLRWHQKVDEHAYKESGNLTSVNNSDKRATIDNTVTLVGFESDLGVAFNKGRTGAAAGAPRLHTRAAVAAWQLLWPAMAASKQATVVCTLMPISLSPRPA